MQGDITSIPTHLETAIKRLVISETVQICPLFVSQQVDEMDKSFQEIVLNEKMDLKKAHENLDSTTNDRFETIKKGDIAEVFGEVQSFFAI